MSCLQNKLFTQENINFTTKSDFSPGKEE